MSAPKRIQMTRQRPWRADNPDAVIVDRRSRWGNPFTIGKPVEIALYPSSRYMPTLRGTVLANNALEAIELFRLGIFNGLKRPAYHYPYVPALSEIEALLRGKDLACWCPLDAPCHGSVLLELANGDTND